MKSIEEEEIDTVRQKTFNRQSQPQFTQAEWVVPEEAIPVTGKKEQQQASGAGCA